MEIDNKKETYTYEEYEIVLEIVKDLGIFMEVEYCTNEDVDVKKEKTKVWNIIKSLGINVAEELSMGKPEMYLRKYNIVIK